MRRYTKPRRSIPLHNLEYSPHSDRFLKDTEVLRKYYAEKYPDCGIDRLEKFVPSNMDGFSGCSRALKRFYASSLKEDDDYVLLPILISNQSHVTPFLAIKTKDSNILMLLSESADFDNFATVSLILEEVKVIYVDIEQRRLSDGDSNRSISSQKDCSSCAVLSFSILLGILQKKNEPVIKHIIEEASKEKLFGAENIISIQLPQSMARYFQDPNFALAVTRDRALHKMIKGSEWLDNTVQDELKEKRIDLLESNNGIVNQYATKRKSKYRKIINQQPTNSSDESDDSNMDEAYKSNEKKVEQLAINDGRPVRGRGNESNSDSDSDILFGDAVRKRLKMSDELS